MLFSVSNLTFPNLRKLLWLPIIDWTLLKLKKLDSNWLIVNVTDDSEIVVVDVSVVICLTVILYFNDISDPPLRKLELTWKYWLFMRLSEAPVTLIISFFLILNAAPPGPINSVVLNGENSI